MYMDTTIVMPKRIADDLLRLGAPLQIRYISLRILENHFQYIVQGFGWIRAPMGCYKEVQRMDAVSYRLVGRVFS